MTDYLTEQEQIELLKNWIKQYSLVILGSVVFTIIVITGWRYWQDRQASIQTHASAIYDDMLTMRARNDSDAITLESEKLYSRYPKTSYGQMAALMMARSAASNKNYADAEKYYNVVIKQSNVPALRQIARIRLARVLIAAQKPADSIKLLEKIDDASFNGLTLEVKGDAYYTMKDMALARQAYQQALAALPNAETMRPLLQMKYDNLVTN